MFIVPQSARESTVFEEKQVETESLHIHSFYDFLHWLFSICNFKGFTGKTQKLEWVYLQRLEKPHACGLQFSELTRLLTNM